MFGGFTNSASLNNDKQVTMIYLQTLASQLGGVWVSLGLPPSSAKSAKRDDINYLGGSLGALAQTPSDASAQEMAQGDLDTGAAYGRRVAAIAARLRASA